MGQQDATQRRVSAGDVDDDGATILHVDMDAFYASVEKLDNPDLANVPVIVGATLRRSVVSSACYQARGFGVRAAMPGAQARRLCPNAVFVPPRFTRYREISQRVMEVFSSFTPLVEQLSIDEAFLDVAGAQRLWGSPYTIAQKVRAHVKDATGLTCSVGAASTKHVAKMASSMCKPDGLLVVSASQTLDFLAPLLVRSVWGVGPAAASALERFGIHTIADIRASREETIIRALGKAMGQHVWALAHGIDDRSVSTHREEKSISHEETFPQDISDRSVLRLETRQLADRVAHRLRSHNMSAAVVGIKVRFSDFHTVNRSFTFATPTSTSQRIGDTAIDLLNSIDTPQAVRLVGVRVERLSVAMSEHGLWNDDEQWQKVDGVVDAASERFGRGSITRATLID